MQSVRALRLAFVGVAFLSIGEFAWQVASSPFSLRTVGHAILMVLFVVSHFQVAVRLRTLLINNPVFIIAVIYARSTLTVLYELVGLVTRDASFLGAALSLTTAIAINYALIRLTKRVSTRSGWPTTAPVVSLAAGVGRLRSRGADDPAFP